jgi:autotransporter-associated beta strand protein
MKSKPGLRQLLLPSVILLATSSAHAESATWNVNAAGNWASGGNWNPASAPGVTSDTTNTDTATFGNVILADRIVTVDTNRNISVIDFNANDFKYTLSGGSLILSSGGTIKTSGAGATHNADTISSPITLANANEATSGTLSILGLSSNTERGLVVSGGITGAATSGTSTLTLGGTTVSNTGARQNKITGDIADGSGGGTLAVEKTGSGLWVLEGAKTFSGGLTVREGDLRIAGNAAAAGIGSITLGDTTGTANASLGINNSFAPTNALIVAAGSSGTKTLTSGNVGSPGYNGAITLNDSLTVAVTTTNDTNTNFTLGGVSGISLNANTLRLLLAPTNSNAITSTITVNKAVSGTGAIEIVGAGSNTNATRVVAINGTNSYTGGTIVAATGTDKSLTVNVSGDQSAANGGWTISNATPNTNTYTVNFLSGSTIGVAAGKDMTLLNGGGIKAMNVAGAVTTGATGNLNIRGNSTLTLDSGANWTQNGGTINIQPQASATNAVMNVNSGAGFTYAGGNDINLAKATGSGAGSATLNLSGGTFTTGRGFSNSAAGAGGGSTNLNFSSGGTLKLSANITSLISVGTNVSTGTGGGIIDTNGFSTALDVGISGDGGLTKAGEGALTLADANSYLGDTTVSAGTLYVTGSLSNSAATVGDNATIGGNGTLGNGLTIAAGGRLDLTGATLGSDSTGILSLSGGSLTLGNLTFLDLVGWNWANAEAGTYELIDGTFTIDWGDTAYLDADSAYDFENGKKGYFEAGSLNVVIIPEPRAALLGGLGLLALLRRRR